MSWFAAIGAGRETGRRRAFQTYSRKKP